MRVKLQSTDGRAARAREEALRPSQGRAGGLERGGRCLSITSLFAAKLEAKPLAERVGGDGEEEVCTVRRMSEAPTFPHQG